MPGKEYTFQQKIDELSEREKELKCLYKVEEIIHQNLPAEDFFMQIISRIPSGWQYPGICRVKITFEGKEYKEKYWGETDWMQFADIAIDDNILGKIEVFYTSFRKMVFDSQFLPEEQKLLNTIAGRISTYIFNKRLEKSVELLRSKKEKIENIETIYGEVLSGATDSHWTWRNKMTEVISEKLDFDRFDVKGIYLIGSAKNGNAGPASDIDLMVHIGDNADKLKELKAWIEGWSLSLSEMNYQKTGYKTQGLIDLHIVTDEDIRNKTSYAIMIGHHTNRAKPIKLKDS